MLKHGSAASSTTKWTEAQGKLTKFKMNDIEGKEFDFGSLKGKAVIITNIACECGFTKGGLTKLTGWKTELKDEPFEAIGFSSNSFNQEKKSGPEVKEYIDEHFGLNFKVMETSDVNGEQTNEVYQWLKESFPGDITWNFSTYFLINHEGIPVQRFEKESWEVIKAAIDVEVQAAKDAAKANAQ